MLPPLLEVARRLVAQGLSPRWTINISPVLAEQLASSVFQKEFEFFIGIRLRSCEDNRSDFRRAGAEALVALTYSWEEYFEREDFVFPDLDPAWARVGTA